MKKILAMSACLVLPMLASGVYAQTAASSSTAPAPATVPAAAAGTNGAAGTNSTADSKSTMPGSNSGSTMPGATPPGSMGTPQGASKPMGSAKSPSVDATQTVTGQSAKDLIGQAIYNEKDEKVGDIGDIAMSVDGKVTAYVVAAGGFLGMGEHNVAIPFDKITLSGDKLILSGVTKDDLKNMPAVKFNK